MRKESPTPRGHSIPSPYETWDHHSPRFHRYRYNRDRHGLWHQRGTVHTQRNYNIQPCSPLHKKGQTTPFLLSYAHSGRTNACLPQGSILEMCKSAKVPENLGDTPMASSQLLPTGIRQEPINTINSKRENIRLTSPTGFSKCGGM